jgi:hypothetical protein
MRLNRDFQFVQHTDGQRVGLDFERVPDGGAQSVGESETVDR